VYKCLNNTFKPQIKIHGGKEVLPACNETVLAYAVAMQPVAAAIDASQPSFELYQSGIYDDPNCSSTELDHVVLVVGYGSEDGKDYWICQNSWGELHNCTNHVWFITPCVMYTFRFVMGNGWLHLDVSKQRQSVRHCH